VLNWQSGVEELNTIDFNLAAHVHCIDGCAIFHASHPDIVASATRLIPADSTASGFYLSNAYNYVLHNAGTPKTPAAQTLHHLTPMCPIPC
jgi:hypothetical protein